MASFGRGGKGKSRTQQVLGLGTFDMHHRGFLKGFLFIRFIPTGTTCVPEITTTPSTLQR